jgi:hypothetical protein
MSKPNAGFEIDQAMAALPAHASLPDARLFEAHGMFFCGSAVLLATQGRSLQLWPSGVKQRIWSRALPVRGA